MEDTLVASYLTLIIGYLILENNEHEEIVRQLMPEKNFSLMVAVLKKFYNFMNLTASVSYYLIKMKNNTIQHYIITELHSFVYLNIEKLNFRRLSPVLGVSKPLK